MKTEKFSHQLLNNKSNILKKKKQIFLKISKNKATENEKLKIIILSNKMLLQVLQKSAQIRVIKKNVFFSKGIFLPSRVKRVRKWMTILSSYIIRNLFNKFKSIPMMLLVIFLNFYFRFFLVIVFYLQYEIDCFFNIHNKILLSSFYIPCTSEWAGHQAKKSGIKVFKANLVQTTYLEYKLTENMFFSYKHNKKMPKPEIVNGKLLLNRIYKIRKSKKLTRNFVFKTNYLSILKSKKLVKNSLFKWISKFGYV